MLGLWEMSIEICELYARMLDSNYTDFDCLVLTVARIEKFSYEVENSNANVT